MERKFSRKYEMKKKMSIKKYKFPSSRSSSRKDLNDSRNSSFKDLRKSRSLTKINFKDSLYSNIQDKNLISFRNSFYKKKISKSPPKIKINITDFKNEYSNKNYEKSLRKMVTKNTGSPNNYELRYQSVSKKLLSKYQINDPIRLEKIGQITLQHNTQIKDYIKIKANKGVLDDEEMGASASNFYIANYQTFLKEYVRHKNDKDVIDALALRSKKRNKYSQKEEFDRINHLLEKRKLKEYSHRMDNYQNSDVQNEIMNTNEYNANFKMDFDTIKLPNVKLDYERYGNKKYIDF